MSIVFNLALPILKWLWNKKTYVVVVLAALFLYFLFQSFVYAPWKKSVEDAAISVHQERSQNQLEALEKKLSDARLALGTLVARIEKSREERYAMEAEVVALTKEHSAVLVRMAELNKKNVDLLAQFSRDKEITLALPAANVPGIDLPLVVDGKWYAAQRCAGLSQPAITLINEALK